MDFFDDVNYYGVKKVVSNRLGLNKRNSFSKIKKLVENGKDKIELNTNFTRDIKERRSFGDIEINKDLIIDGKGHYIDGDGTGSIFNVVKGNVTFKNIIFKNASSAIKISNKESSCEIIDCHFLENFSYSSDNIAFVDNEGVLKVKNSFFASGKVVMVSNKNELEIIGTEFKSNDSNINNNGKFEIRDSNFNGNKIRLNNYENSEMTISNVSFSDNLHDILHNSGILRLSNIHFENNDVSESIIFNDMEGELRIDESNFKMNRLGIGAIHNNGLCEIKAVKFEGNETKYDWKEKKAADIFNESKLILEGIEIINDKKTILNEGKILFDELDDEIIDKIENHGTIGADSNDFRDLNALINENEENEIILESDYAVDELELELFESGIMIIKDNLIIDGNNHTIDGKGLNGFFTVNGRNITFKNIIFKNGSPQGDSGAINNDSSSSFHNCNFENMNGKLLKNNGDCSFHDCKFEKLDGVLNIENYDSIKIFDSEVTESTGLSIYNNEGKVCISNSHIISSKSNSIENLSGEISIDCVEFKTDYNNIENNDGFIKIEKADFNNKRITIKNIDGKIDLFKSKINASNIIEPAIQNYGGTLNIDNLDLNDSLSAILNENEGTLSITNSSFRNNREILKNISGEISLTDVTFIDNKADADFDALSNYRGHMDIASCRFLGNHDYQNVILNKSELFISNSIFSDNGANQIIKNEDKEEGVLSINNGEFVENTIDAASIVNNGKTTSLSKTIFENNKLIGGGFSDIINDSGLIFIRPIFKNDTQSILNLGNINTKKESKSKYERYIDNRGVLEDEIPPKEERCDFSYLDSLIHNEDNRKEIFLKKDIRFGNYEIDYYEGGIDLDMDGLVIDGKGNTIYGDGKSRIFIISGENITIKNINFNQGFSSKTLFNVIDGGGLIKINSKSNVNFENCTFEYGFSQEEGGAIHNKVGSTCIINNCRFHGNSAKEKGGAIVNEGILKVDDSKFYENSTDGLGGAISNYGDIELTDVCFKSNGEFINSHNENSVNYSGVIYNCGIVDSSNADFISNDGDVIVNDQSGAMILNESEFNGNEGVLIQNDNPAEVTINDSLFNNNCNLEGQYEGLINNSGKINFNRNSIIANASEKSFINNFENGNIEISNSEFENNGSESSGPIIHNDRFCKIIFNHSKMNNNIRQCISNYGELSVSASDFNNNKGGVIFNTDDLRVNNSNFENNDASNGAAIYSRRGNAKVVDSKFKGNKANNGGAIYNTEGGPMHSGLGLRSCTEGIILIENSYFENNGASSNGGAVFNNDDGALIVERCEFQGNSAQSGGAIYSIHAEFNYLRNRLEISNCSYSNNSPNNVYTDAVLNEFGF